MSLSLFRLFTRRAGTVRNLTDAAALGLPVLGSIAEFEPRPGARLPGEEYPEALEAYQRLTDAVRSPDFNARGRVVVVTSALSGAGKSTTAKNLATLLARGGNKVILVDADMKRVARRRPGDGTSSSGFAGLLVNQLMRPANALVHTLDVKLKLLPAGSVAGQVETLMLSPRLPRVVEGLRDLADYVIFDAGTASDQLRGLVDLADVTLLVLCPEVTSRKQAERAASLLRNRSAGLTGVLLNRTPAMAGAPPRETRTSPVEEAAEIAGATEQRLEIAVDDLLADLEGALRLIRDIRRSGQDAETEEAITAGRQK